MSLFDVDVPHRSEIVEGLFREGQIVTIAGAYNVGKTPLLAHIALCVVHGINWCGRTTQKRHIIHIDYESSVSNFIQTYRNISTAWNMNFPKTPEEVDAYLLNSDFNHANTQQLFKVKSITSAETFLRARLQKYPKSLIVIDPVEMFFPALTLSKPDHALEMVRFWRSLFSAYPQSGVITSYNLRKLDVRAAKPPDLIENPHGWLREISGSNNLLNRSDVRMGMDRHPGDDVRLINGIRRGEDMHPILLLPVEVENDPERLGGYKAIAGSSADLKKALGQKMFDYYSNLPSLFRFNDVANNGVPRTSLFRILKTASSMGHISKVDGEWSKNTAPYHGYVEPELIIDDN